MLLKFYLHQMQYLAFSKRSERPFLAQSNRSFSHIWVNCPCGHCGETRANVGRKTGRIDISVTDGWVINNGDKGGWISNSLTLGDTSDTTSNNGGMGLKGKERCPDIEERDERCARCFSPNLKNSITVKIDKNAAAKAVLSFRDSWRHRP